MPVVNMDKTGAKIKAYMKEFGYSVADLQKILGLAGPQAIYHWLSGMCIPKLDNLVVLAALFGVTVDDIVVVDMV